MGKKEKKTKIRKKITSNKKRLVKRRGIIRSEIRELSDQFSVDHFLIDEQIYYSQQLAQESEKKKKKASPVADELEKIISSSSDLASVSQEIDSLIKTAGVKVALNKKGAQANIIKKSAAGRSAYTVDLSKGKEGIKLPFKKPQLNHFYQEFKVTKPTLDVPAPSLLKRKVIKEQFTKLKEGLKTLSKVFKRRPKLPRTKPLHQCFSPWRQKLKTALNFALVALLFIVPIRGYVLYNQVTNTQGKVLGVTEEAILGFQEGIEAAAQADWLKASLNFNKSADYFAQAQIMVNNYQSLINFLESVPLASQKIEDGKNLLQAGQLFSQAAINLSGIVGQINQTAVADNPPAQSLVTIKQGVNQSISDLNQAFGYLENVSSNSIPLEYRESFIELQSNLPLLLNSLAEINKLLDLTLTTLGYNAPQRYLIVNLNNNELRASGGFMGSYALADFKDGKIINLEVPGGGFYDLKGDFFEKVIAPEPMHLLGTPWMPWDANCWWPDFSTAMEKLLWFYYKSGGPTVDGVIAINASVMPELLKITGNIEMPEYNEIFTPENVVLALMHKTEFEYDPAENKPKKVIGDLMSVLIERLMAVSTEQMIPLLFTLKDSLENKDVQFYFTNEELQKQARAFGWTGEIKDTNDDYLQVTRINIGGGKTDGFINQQIKHYAYIQEDGSIVDTAAITLTHNGNLIDQSDAAYVFAKVLNKSFVRVYVPKDSQLLEASGYDAIDPNLFKEVYPGYVRDSDLERISGQSLVDAKTNTRINNELGKTVFSNWLTLHPGESKTLTFSYRLPQRLNFNQGILDSFLILLGLKESQVEKSYSLLLQNQSGAKNTTFESRLYLPENMSIVWSDASEGQLVASGQSASFKTDLDKDYLYGVLIEESH